MKTTNKILKEFNNEYYLDKQIFEELEKYTLGDEPPIKVLTTKENDLMVVDVEWSYRFKGKKNEREKVIRFLKNEGFCYSKESGGFYLRVTDDIREKMTMNRKIKYNKLVIEKLGKNK